MNKKTITPNLQQPVERKPAGQLPTALAELVEAVLSDTNALPLSADALDRACSCSCAPLCSYDGDEE